MWHSDQADSMAMPGRSVSLHSSAQGPTRHRRQTFADVIVVHIPPQQSLSAVTRGLIDDLRY